MAKGNQTLEKQAGIILRTSPLRESDLLVTLLAEHAGKVSLVARGARRSKKRFMGGLDLFDLAVFEFSLPREDPSALGVLNSAVESFLLPGLRTDLRRFQAASLAVELADQFSPEGFQEASSHFPLLKECLVSLEQAKDVRELLSPLSAFLFELLAESGYDILSTAQPELIYAARPDADEDELKQAVRTLLRFVEELLAKQLKTRSGITFL